MFHLCVLRWGTTIMVICCRKFGKDALLLLRQECSCFGKNALASARMLLLRQECSCFGKNVLVSAGMLLLRQECSCFGKNPVASARMLLLATSFLDAALLMPRHECLGGGGGRVRNFTTRWVILLLDGSFATTELEIGKEILVFVCS